MKRLHGFSGCVVELVGPTVVRKSAGTPEYSDRLLAQSRKQRALAALVPCPRVLAEGWDGGIYWFEMEFVEGLDLLDAANVWGVHFLDIYADTVLAFLGRCAAAGDGDIPAAAFTDKLDAIAAGIPKVFGESQRRFLLRLAAELKALDWSGIPATPSHGDLTIENAVVRHDGSIHFIDFLDGPLSSVWLDLAKVRQDTRGFWRLRPRKGQGRGADTLDNAILLNHLDRILNERLRGTALDDPTREHRLTLFQLMRIVPYCTNAQVAAFLANRLKKLHSKELAP